MPRRALALFSIGAALRRLEDFVMRTFLRKGVMLPNKFFDRKTNKNDKKMVTIGVDSIMQGSRLTPSKIRAGSDSKRIGVVCSAARGRRLKIGIKRLYLFKYGIALKYT